MNLHIELPVSTMTKLHTQLNQFNTDYDTDLSDAEFIDFVLTVRAQSLKQVQKEKVK